MGTHTSIMGRTSTNRGGNISITMDAHNGFGREQISITCLIHVIYNFNTQQAKI